MSQRLVVLNWHNVATSWCFPAPEGAARAGFRAQVRWLRRWATVVDLEPALRSLAEGRPLPRRAVALTFDDGYEDNLSVALPILQQLGLPATFFLIPGVLDGVVDPWWERLGWAFTHGPGPRDDGEFEQVCAALKMLDEPNRQQAVAEVIDAAGIQAPRRPVPFLDWDGARQLVDRGFSVGSHSANHAILSRETAAAQLDNLASARSDLQRRLGVDANLLAYPNGTTADYDAATLAGAEQCGHTHALTTEDGWNTAATPPFELHRFVVYPERGVAGLAVVLRHLLGHLPGRRAA